MYNQTWGLMRHNLNQNKNKSWGLRNSIYNIFQFDRLNYNISIKIKIILMKLDLIIPATQVPNRISYTNTNYSLICKTIVVQYQVTKSISHPYSKWLVLGFDINKLNHIATTKIGLVVFHCQNIPGPEKTILVLPIWRDWSDSTARYPPCDIPQNLTSSHLSTTSWYTT